MTWSSGISQVRWVGASAGGAALRGRSRTLRLPRFAVIAEGGGVHDLLGVRRLAVGDSEHSYVLAGLDIADSVAAGVDDRVFVDHIGLLEPVLTLDRDRCV